MVPSHDPRFQQAVVSSRQEVIAAAERHGIEAITSLMMLESCCQTFSSPVSTQAEVLADLEHFSKQAQNT